MRDYGQEDEAWLIKRNIAATDSDIERFIERVGIMLDGKTDESAVEVARVNAYKGIFK